MHMNPTLKIRIYESGMVGNFYNPNTWHAKGKGLLQIQSQSELKVGLNYIPKKGKEMGIWE